jgi:tRNA(Ile)-lysidine synthase
MNPLFENIAKKFNGERIALAVSGGADSMAMMHLCNQYGKNGMVVLHVDHGLRKTSANDSEFVAQAAAALNMPCVVLKWTGDKPKTGVEAAARTARYELMLDWCRENKVEFLLVAHNADDQIETFLMNLGRGSGVYGLAAMSVAQPRDKVLILRPVLHMKHESLEKYCAENQIKYIHDEMNDDENFTRVKIRKNRHVMRDRLDISDDRILSAIEHLGRVRDMLEMDVDKLVQSVLADDRAVFASQFFFDMPDEVRLKFLSRILQIIGKSAYGPRLEKIVRADYMLQSDCKFTANKCIVRRLGNKILIAPEGASVSFRKILQRKICPESEKD